MSHQHDEELIYGFDPLCGWCFAFRPTMHAITDAHPDLSVRVLYGGLVLGERVRPIAEDRDYLVRGLEEVRRRSGVVAGERFYNGLLAEGTYVSNSEPPCRALYVMQQLAPERVYSFADALPDAYYGHGLPLDSEIVLGELAAAQGVDHVAFLQMWRSEEAKVGIQSAFARARAAGVTMYPTLFYRRGDRAQLIGRGFIEPAVAVDLVSAARGTGEQGRGNREESVA
jgi:putative protein-disulfide isomerase